MGHRVGPSTERTLTADRPPMDRALVDPTSLSQSWTDSRVRVDERRSWEVIALDQTREALTDVRAEVAVPPEKNESREGTLPRVDVGGW